MDFETFYRAQRDDLLRLCFLVTLDVDAASDATQEALLRAWVRWDSFEDQEPKAWVRTVALNLCRSRWRRLERELRLSPRLYKPRQGTQVRDLDVAMALGHLSPRQREAVVLFYWADMTVDECANVMSVTPGAIKQHLARARQRLNDDPTLTTTEERL